MKIKLRDIITRKNITIYRLSKMTDISQNNLQKIVDGETISIKYDNLEKICKVLHITPNDIFEIEYVEEDRT